MNHSGVSIEQVLLAVPSFGLLQLTAENSHLTAVDFAEDRHSAPKAFQSAVSQHGAEVSQPGSGVPQSGAIQAGIPQSGAIQAGIPQSGILAEAAEQLLAYFRGERMHFSLPLMPKGTIFQQKVWAALQDIPYGKTASYKDIAIRVGSPKGARAVGLANNRNPIAIIIPCHRVIGADGSLTGYAGGLGFKAALLRLEGARP